MDAIDQIAAQDFRWGDLQCIRYDPKRPEFQGFGSSYLVYLYERAKSSGRSRLGILPNLFCGFRDLECESVIRSLGAAPLIVMGEWRKMSAAALQLDEFIGLPNPYFHALGFAFPAGQLATSSLSSPTSPGNSMFGGYAFFQDSWGQPEQTVLMYLGLAYLFSSFNLLNLHGTRYKENVLTARWCARFGFRDLGTIPNYMYREADGKLADAVISTLDRAGFESRLSRVLQEAAGI